MEEIKEEKKLSYEELEGVCHQLSEQNRQLYARMQDMNATNLFKRLDYLFKIVENAKEFPAEFVNKCVEEIVVSITIPEQKEEETKEES